MEQDEQPRQELVKCVLVGDNAVGKTRLICAKATRQQCSLSQLLNPHVPTVWAIDQYRIYKEVLRNSRTVLDGVNVSLRLWDTFGDHHKDRRFAYARSDVVLICFDVGRLNSLENCRDMWYHQVRKFCPNTPVMMVGCKNDIRFIYKDSMYLNYCKERSPLVRQVRESDIIMPDQARSVAKDLGLSYYETSVLTYFGIDEVFENAIRAALCTRRQQSFWMTNLRKVLKPSLQEPFCPPKPQLPEAHTLESTYRDEISKMLDQQFFTDVIFLCDGVGFSAHRFFLAASSPLLFRIFTTDFSSQDQPDIWRNSSSETSLLGSSGYHQYCVTDTEFINDDTEFLIQSEGGVKSTSSKRTTTTCGEMAREVKCFNGFNSIRRRRRRSSLTCLPSQLFAGKTSSTIVATSHDVKAGAFRVLNYPAFQSIRTEQCLSLDVDGHVLNSVQTVLSCTKLVTQRAMSHVMQFLYCGRLNLNLCEPQELEDLKLAAEFLDISDLYRHFMDLASSKRQTSEMQSNDTSPNSRQTQLQGFQKICLQDSLFTDVSFLLEDGTTKAHKPMLMARSEMMRAMFSHNDFRERSARVVHFPGICKLTFDQLLHYMYTDQTPPWLDISNCVELIELADRLCLPRLVSLIETAIIKQMESTCSVGGDFTEEALAILQPCQMHNAKQLGNWCLAYLSHNYNYICRKYPKTLRALHPENQAALNVNRWPPVWYLKDLDNYQRMQLDREREEGPKNLKRTRRNSGCLCFSSKARRDGIKYILKS